MDTANKRGRKKKEADYNNIFSVRLRELINERKVTQQEISENITASRQALNKWVNGETVPDILAAAELADYFGVSLDYLTGRGTTRSSDEDMVIACEVTGLSEEAINSIRLDLFGKETDYKAVYNAFIEEALPELICAATSYTSEKIYKSCTEEYFKSRYFGIEYTLSEAFSEKTHDIMTKMKQSEKARYTSIFVHYYNSLCLKSSIDSPLSGQSEFLEYMLTKCILRAIDTLYPDELYNFANQWILDNKIFLDEVYNELFEKEVSDNAKHNPPKE